MNYPDIVSFHGHECPCLAIGYRMVCAAMKALNAERSSDEELVAIVENDACGVDALQCVSGCTFGKGNLLFRDYGKQGDTLYSRSKEWEYASFSMARVFLSACEGIDQRVPNSSWRHLKKRSCHWHRLL